VSTVRAPRPRPLLLRHRMDLTQPLRAQLDRPEPCLAAAEQEGGAQHDKRAAARAPLGDSSDDSSWLRRRRRQHGCEDNTVQPATPCSEPHRAEWFKRAALRRGHTVPRAAPCRAEGRTLQRATPGQRATPRRERVRGAEGRTVQRTTPGKMAMTVLCRARSRGHVVQRRAAPCRGSRRAEGYVAQSGAAWCRGPHCAEGHAGQPPARERTVAPRASRPP
jgi:hypothetical protein